MASLTFQWKVNNIDIRQRRMKIWIFGLSGLILNILTFPVVYWQLSKPYFQGVVEFPSPIRIHFRLTLNRGQSQDPSQTSQVTQVWWAFEIQKSCTLKKNSNSANNLARLSVDTTETLEVTQVVTHRETASCFNKICKVLRKKAHFLSQGFKTLVNNCNKTNYFVVLTKLICFFLLLSFW